MHITRRPIVRKKTTLLPTWSGAFTAYYNDHIGDRVESSYTGHLRKIGLNVDSITTNMSECMNDVIKEFQGWKENTPDVCLLSSHRLQLYFQTQINRGSASFGPFTLNSSEETG